MMTLFVEEYTYPRELSEFLPYGVITNVDKNEKDGDCNKADDDKKIVYGDNN